MNGEGIGLCLTDPKEQAGSLKKEEKTMGSDVNVRGVEDIWEGVAQLGR